MRIFERLVGFISVMVCPMLYSFINDPIKPLSGPISVLLYSAAYPITPLDKFVNMYGATIQSDV